MTLASSVNCSSCGYEDYDINVIYVRTVANGDVYQCPICKEEIMSVELHEDELSNIDDGDGDNQTSEKIKTEKYSLYTGFGPERKEKEVTKQEFIRAERNAGFRPKLASDHPDYMNTCATGGFGSGNNGGSIKYM
jgi:hypothetical protein